MNDLMEMTLSTFDPYMPDTTQGGPAAAPAARSLAVWGCAE
jgi:hypothetical protein